MKNNILTKAFSILMPVGIVLTFFQSTRAKAENNIIWKAVPGTAILKEGNSKPQPD